MTQEEKELLLQDFCGRLPYGVKIHGPKENDDILWELDYNINIKKIVDDGWLPYLRPLSTMTKKEREEYRKFSYYGAFGIRNEDFTDTVAVPSFEKIDYLNSHHFDYRGLIEKGLAIEAPDGMYNEITTCNSCESKDYCSQSEYVKTHCYKLQ